MIHKRGLGAVAVLLLALLGCEHKPRAGEEVSSACRVENNSKEISVSGYLQAPILFGCEKTVCSFELTPHRSGTYDLRIDIPVGSGPSTMTPLAPSKHDSIPGQITAEDVTIELRDAKGASVGVRDVVRVTGKMNAYKGSDDKVQCSLDVKTLERL